MALPGVSLSIQDFGLGLTPPSTAKTQLKIGVAPLGLVNTILSATDLTTLTNQLGLGGPLVEAAARVIQQGAPVYCMPVNPSTYGTVGAVTKTASSTTSALAIAAKPFQQLIAKVAAGGALGVAMVQFSTDGGNTFGAAVATAATVMVPQAPFVTVAFGVGTYVAGDSWTIATDGTVTFSGTGFNGLTISSVSPVDAYNLVVTCTAAGVLGAAQFTYSLDNGNTVSGAILVPASGKYVIPNTGLLLTFSSGPLAAGEAWSCAVTAASYSTTDLTNAVNAALADTRTWGFVHVVGPAATVAGAATVLATLDSLLATAAGQFRYARGIIEVPVDTDANILAAFAASSSLRVNACPGFCYSVSPLNGRQQLVSSAWPFAARAGAIPLSEDVGRVASGALTGVSLTAANAALPKQRDESATPGLDAGRFSVLTSITGRQGVYFTSSRFMAPAGSDYTYWPNGRVMDEACRVSRNTLLNYVNTQIRVNGLQAAGNPGDPGSPGTILEKEARGIEGRVDNDIRDSLIRRDPQDANDVAVVVSRTQNVLSTSTLPVSVRVQPNAYARFITENIGFAVSLGK